MKYEFPKVLTVLASLALTTLLQGAPPVAATVPGTKPATEKLTVAVLDFEAGTTGAADTGKNIAETLGTLLVDTPGFKFVDRTSMHKTLEEHALNLSGLVDADNAVKIGKLVGARLLITGKAFTLGKTTYITAKIIGTETSLVEGVLSKGKEGEDIGILVADLADKLQKRLTESGPKLVAGPDADDGVAALKAKLAKLVRPKVAVNAKEEHHAAARQAIDPAVDTELKSLLQQCDFTVIQIDQISGAGVDLVVNSEAFSEFAVRVGNLISCSARVEINIVRRSDGKILFTDRATGRAADLSEQMAAKAALQKAGHTAGIKILEYFAQSLPPEKAK